MRKLLIIDQEPHYVAMLDQVPHTGSQVIYNHKTYLVTRIQWDLDEGEVRIYLFKP